MAIRIENQRPVIPIEIGSLKFEFDVSDESIKKLIDSVNNIEQELDDVQVVDGEEGIDPAARVLRKGYDLILGEGAYDKVYEICPSNVMMMAYFAQITEGLNEELAKLGYTSKNKSSLYLVK